MVREKSRMITSLGNYVGMYKEQVRQTGRSGQTGDDKILFLG